MIQLLKKIQDAKLKIHKEKDVGKRVFFSRMLLLSVIVEQKSWWFLT
jgi:hypothetical protein